MIDFPTIAALLNIVTAVPAVIAGVVCAVRWRKTPWRWVVCVAGVVVVVYTAVAYGAVVIRPTLNIVLLRWVLSFWHLFFFGLLFLISTVQRAMSDAECQDEIARLKSEMADIQTNERIFRELVLRKHPDILVKPEDVKPK